METGVGKIALESVRKMTTREIVESLRPGARAPLKVKPQGDVDIIMDGNTRIKVLRERGYDVESLPRVPYDQ
jgi:hypothetical protein